MVYLNTNNFCMNYKFVDSYVHIYICKKMEFLFEKFSKIFNMLMDYNCIAV